LSPDPGAASKPRVSTHSPATAEAGSIRLWDRAVHAGYRSAAKLVLSLAHAQAGRFGAGTGRLAWWLLPRRRRAARDNALRILAELPERSRVAAARASFENFGRFIFEQVSTLRFEPSQLEHRFDLRGEEHLLEARERGRGVVVLTGHFGPFDLASAVLRPRLGRFHLVHRPTSNPLIDREQRALRERFGVELVPRQRVAQRLFLALRRGDALGVAIDQRVNPLAGILVDFLGRPAWTSSVPALLQLHTGAPVVPLFTYLTAPGRYRLEIDPPIPTEDLGDDPEAELTRRYFEPLERRIRRDPEQWLWMHDRWRLVFRHRDPRFRERLARESGLDGLPRLDTTSSAGHRELGRDAGRAIEWRSLEDCRNVLLAGAASPDDVRAAGRAMVAAALARGWAARAEHAAALAARLRDAEAAGRLGAELRELDRRALVWIEDLGSIADGDHRRLLAAQLERRAGRGSLVLDASPPPRRIGDALDAARERAAQHALAVRI
jgi:KDO2-lipid IV(A) lauroyltransferase